jgi:hypothetical protein
VVSTCLLHDLVRHTVGPSGRVMNDASQSRRTTQRRNIKIHASSGIRTHDTCNQAVKSYSLDRAATGTGLFALRQWIPTCGSQITSGFAEKVSNGVFLSSQFGKTISNLVSFATAHVPQKITSVHCFLTRKTNV